MAWMVDQTALTALEKTAKLGWPAAPMRKLPHDFWAVRLPPNPFTWNAKSAFKIREGQDVADAREVRAKGQPRADAVREALAAGGLSPAIV